MIFEPAPLDGAFLVKLERRGDARGSFARSFCTTEFAAHGLETSYVQHNVSVSAQAGTLRGMHFQTGAAAEVKVIRCSRGRLFDVLVDLRPGSPSYGQWFGTELSADNGVQLYAPAGLAHGFLTLTDDCETTYLVSQPYTPAAEGGLRWNDPCIGIVWPMAPKVIAPRDANWPDYPLATR